MIKILITRKEDIIIRVEVKGHAGYAEYGKDIVCSAVSGIVQTVGASLDLMQKDLTTQKEGHVMIDVTNIDDKYMHDAQVLLDALVLGCDNIRKQYPKNIKMEEKVL